MKSAHKHKFIKCFKLPCFCLTPLLLLPIKTGVVEAKASSNSLTGDIKITIVNKGYGTNWLHVIADSYTEQFPGCSINISETTEETAVAAKIKTTANDSDLVISTGNFFNEQYEGYLVDLTDLYESVQDGYDKPLKERMNKSIRDFYEDKQNHFYQIPWIFGKSGLLCNKTVVNQTLGNDVVFPRTTNELVSFCQNLKDHGVYPFSMSTSVPYWQGFMVSLYYQYQGPEEYNNFYKGYYKKDGHFQMATEENYEEYLRSQIGVRKAADIVYDLIATKQFAHPKSDYMNFMESQAAFCGLGYGDDKTKCALMFNGSWFAQECSNYMQLSGDEIIFLTNPVMSSIVERLENQSLTDSELSAIVDSIDHGATSYPGLSDNDFNRIKSARYSSTCSAAQHSIVIPKIKNGQNKTDLTKQFLNYMFSLEGQELFSYSLDGLTMPFGYNPIGLYDSFENSILESMGDIDEFAMISEGKNSPLYYVGGLDIIIGYYEGDAFNKTRNPEQYVDFCVERSLTTKAKVLPLIVEEDFSVSYKIGPTVIILLSCLGGFLLLFTAFVFVYPILNKKKLLRIKHLEEIYEKK